MKTHVKTNIKVDLINLRCWYDWLNLGEKPIHKSWETDYGSDYFEEGSEGFGWSLHGFEEGPSYQSVEWKDEETANHPMLRSKGIIKFGDDDWIHICNTHYTQRRDIVKDNYMGEILDFFEGSYRGVVWAIRPGFKFVPHIDYPNRDTYRMHIPLHTNSDSGFQIGEEEFHMPADGYVWMINTGSHIHTAWNEGSSSRIHIHWQMPPESFDTFVDLNESI